MEQQINYQRIAKAIDYIKTHIKQQPQLDDIAAVVGMSPFHFQRIFTQWAGVSPKKFMQYLNVEYAKQALQQSSSLLETAMEVGLSGTGRLHDLFISIEAMTPGEFKLGGENLTICYRFADTPFGKVVVGSTHKGVCQIFFEEDEVLALYKLQRHYPKAHILEQADVFQHEALAIFQHDWQHLAHIKLHLHGSAFQLKVWQALLNIPSATLTSYGHLAKNIGMPKASRAVGTAIGSNPVAFLIPCHRVIQSSGNIGGYMWGSTRKSAMIGWEAAQAKM